MPRWLPGPMDMLMVVSRAMVGLSPRSLSCRNTGLARELGLQLAMVGGALYLSGDTKGQSYSSTMGNSNMFSYPSPLRNHLGR